MKTTRTILLATALMILTAAVVSAADPVYVDLTPRLEKWYRTDGAKSDDLRLHTFIAGTLNGVVIQEREVLRGDDVVSSERMLFSRSQEGHVLYHGDPDREVFAEPVTWVHHPLDVGKSWSDSVPAKSGTTYYVFAVLEETDITCPAGTFPCYRVLATTVRPNGSIANCQFWYNQQCGLIRCHNDGESAFALQKAQILDGPIDPGDDLDRPVAPDLTGLTVGPNPSNPMTTIRFRMTRAAPVSVEVYDLAGRRIRSLARNEPRDAGPCVYAWDGRDDAGRAVASGSYVARVQGGKVIANQRMVLVR